MKSLITYTMLIASCAGNIATANPISHIMLFEPHNLDLPPRLATTGEEPKFAPLPVFDMHLKKEPTSTLEGSKANSIVELEVIRSE